MASNSRAAVRDEVVSFDSEELILVNENDEEVGHLDKSSCHDGDGVLHRAFSLFIFNARGELLLQQRSGEKRLWPRYWSNSCCSHPRRGESMEQAIHRRLHQELGVDAELEHLFKFQYTAQYEDAGSERELCWVYAGRTDAQPEVNRAEIEAWRFVSAKTLEAELDASPGRFTPWFKMEWQRITKEFTGEIARLQSLVPSARPPL
ncbi:MAG: isopentenyl-diphosphate Delta-isomerase [Pseudomonadales bacterium]